MIENLFGGGGGGGGLESVVAGTGISVDNTNPDNPIITNTSLNTDETAKVSSNDTTAGYLNGKLVAGSGISLTENNNGGNETLAIAAAVTSVNGQTGAVTVGETTYTTTIADAENTTSTITLAQFTVPANTWVNGEELVLDMHFLYLNNTGSTQGVFYTVGGTGITDQTSNQLSVGNVTTQQSNRTRLRFVRLGSGVAHYWIPANNVINYADSATPPMKFQPTDMAWDTSVDFTTDVTIYVKSRFLTASASLYLRTEHARAYKIPAGSV